jgi:hypothetical protein
MHQSPSGSMFATSSFQSTFSNALRTYKRRTKEDLLLLPLAARLQTCDSPVAVLSVLQEESQQSQAFDPSRSGDEGWYKWLSPTVNVLFALSPSVEEGVGLVVNGTF